MDVLVIGESYFFGPGACSPPAGGESFFKVLHPVGNPQEPPKLVLLSRKLKNASRVELRAPLESMPPDRNPQLPSFSRIFHTELFPLQGGKVFSRSCSL